MGFFRQEYWSGMPFPPPGDIPDPGIEPASLVSPALASGLFTTSATWEAKAQPHPFRPLAPMTSRAGVPQVVAALVACGGILPIKVYGGVALSGEAAHGSSQAQREPGQLPRSVLLLHVVSLRLVVSVDELASGSSRRGAGWARGLSCPSACFPDAPCLPCVAVVTSPSR